MNFILAAQPSLILPNSWRSLLAMHCCFFFFLLVTHCLFAGYTLFSPPTLHIPGLCRELKWGGINFEGPRSFLMVLPGLCSISGLRHITNFTSSILKSQIWLCLFSVKTLQWSPIAFVIKSKIHITIWEALHHPAPVNSLAYHLSWFFSPTGPLSVP